MAALAKEDADWMNNYAATVGEAFAALFQADARFQDWRRPMDRFTEGVSSVLKHGFSRFLAVEEAQNELCIAEALLANSTLRFARVEYEPRFDGCSQSIDFRATTAGGQIVYADVKTIQPRAKDRWEQFERAKHEKWLPDNMSVFLSKPWLGGEIWHSKFAARSRMLEHTCALEKKVADAGLAGCENTVVILAFCGSGFHWHVDELEDFVAFYRTGRHRSDDPLARVESDYIEGEKIGFAGTIARFACMKRAQCSRQYTLNWNVQ